MITVVTLLKLKPSPNGEQHGERAFWRELGPRYLDAWLASVDRYVPPPKRIVVMTDAVDTIVRPLLPNTHALHVVSLDRAIDAPGFWSKLNMFREEASEGKTLYCDLDNVINGPLDQLCALEPDPLIMLDDRRVPRLPNGSAILFDAERCRSIWHAYASYPRGCESRFVANGEDYSLAYDQAFIASCVRSWGFTVPLFQDLLPRGYCLNAYSELPQDEDCRDTHLIFGCGAAAKPHTSAHPAFALR